MSSIVRTFTFVTLLAAAACSADATEDESESSEEAVSAARAIGIEMTPVRVLAAKSFAGRPPARLRSDVSVAAPAGLDPIPREVRRATSRVFTWNGESRLVLSADASRTSAIVADDFVLVEVLDASTGAVLGARTIGAAFDVRVAGVVAKPAALAGGLAEITQIAPVGRAFRLRLSGLDVGGEASVSDAFLSAVALPADPYEPGSCAGPMITREQALAYIPPGKDYHQPIPVTDSNVRTVVRTCGPTGCGEWRDAAYTGESALEGDFVVTSLGAHWRVGVRFSPEDLRGRIVPFVERDGTRLFANRPRPEDVTYRETGRYAWSNAVSLYTETAFATGDTAASINESGAVFGETTVHVGKECYQLRNTRRDGDKEILTVAYGRFAPPPER